MGAISSLDIQAQLTSLPRRHFRTPTPDGPASGSTGCWDACPLPRRVCGSIAKHHPTCLLLLSRRTGPRMASEHFFLFGQTRCWQSPAPTPSSAGRTSSEPGAHTDTGPRPHAASIPLPLGQRPHFLGCRGSGASDLPHSIDWPIFTEWPFPALLKRVCPCLEGGSSLLVLSLSPV